MPSAAPLRSAGYRVGKPRGTCFVTGEAIGAGEPYVGVLREAEDGFERVDAKPAAWEAADDEVKGQVIAKWHATMPAEDRGADDKLAVNDDLLAELLLRLEGEADPEKIAFRFVIGLMLMRSRRLAFLDESTDGEGREVWNMRFRGGDRQFVTLLDPKLDAAALESASDRVSRMLAEGVDRSEVEPAEAESTGGQE